MYSLFHCEEPFGFPVRYAQGLRALGKLRDEAIFIPLTKDGAGLLRSTRNDNL